MKKIFLKHYRKIKPLIDSIQQGNKIYPKDLAELASLLFDQLKKDHGIKKGEFSRAEAEIADTYPMKDLTDIMAVCIIDQAREK